ncbi:MAG: hypothetical protein HYZ57_07685 [Acidobacteria bacterium]|nr:hypothetical protein [Acidobacteriota bacterium]
MNTNCKLFLAVAAAAPIALFAFSSGPPLKRSGVPADGGLDCSACHRITTLGDAKSDPRGRVTIRAGNYTPGVRQTIFVTVEHPEATRWGFQLTARQVADETKMAGSFAPVSSEVQVRCDDGTARGAAKPSDGCGAQLEFALHTSEGTSVGTTGSKTWEIEWTPPSDDVGDVIIYVAGNAANNSGNNQGDRIYLANLTVRNEGACTLTTRPTLRAVGNAASFQPPLSMNALFSLFGLNFQVPGRSRTVTAGDIRDNRFPNELGCIAVEVAGQRVPVTYVQNDQINAQVPTITQTGPVEVRVILNPGRANELRSDVATATLQTHSPGFFTFNGRSIAALHAGTATPVADPAVVSTGRPARPGDIIELYLTGLGPTEPVFQAGEIVSQAARLREATTVTVGGTTLAAADVLYAGSAPNAISGLYQLNIRMPQTAPDGDVPVTVRVGGFESQANATIPVRR